MARTFERSTYLLLTGVTVGLLAGVFLDRLLGSDEWRLFQSVRRLARESFVEEVDDQQLFHDSLRGMIAGLDRHSRFYTPEQVAALDRETSGEFHGIGVVFRSSASVGQILFAYPDSPAERAGLGVGDRIVAIDGALLETMEPGELQDSMQGRTSLVLSIEGLDGAARQVTVHPESVVDPSVRHAELLDAARGVGYLAILSFSHRTASEFDAALARLDAEGLERLIIDLRGNPGGILEAAVAIANRFVAEGPLVLTETRAGTRIDVADPERATHVGLPLVLLVDENSASASEVLAGCLQDYGAAVLIGDPTYGKGTVQTLNRIEAKNVVVKLTTAVYYTPLLRRIERDGDHPGLTPDVQLSATATERRRVYRYLGRYTVPDESLAAIRTWEATLGEALLQTAPADQQLELALDLLTDALAAR
ncbi:MAG: S41 family peptidase [Planctomycetota bacterium]